MYLHLNLDLSSNLSPCFDFRALHICMCFRDNLQAGNLRIENPICNLI